MIVISILDTSDEDSYRTCNSCGNKIQAEYLLKVGVLGAGNTTTTALCKECLISLNESITDILKHKKKRG